jgi:hypothetical protein
MKIDPGIHIVMHLVFFGKTSVTVLVGVCDGLMIRMVVLAGNLCGFAILKCFAHV